MAVRRILEVLLVSALLANVASAQTYSLSETIKTGDCFQMHLETTVAGEIRVRRDDQVVPIKHELSAVHDFPERVLSVASNGLPEKTARIYEKARSVIAVSQEKSEQALRPDRTLFVAARNKDQTTLYCPVGPITRGELSLIDHLDLLVVPGLLPGKEVALGATWEVPNLVVQALCGFEGLTEQKLVCKLEEVKGPTARVSVTGSSTGIEVGALVKLTVEATYEFDLASQRLTRLEWKQKEERDQAPASPAASVVATTILTRNLVQQPEGLSDVALRSVPDGLEPPAPVLQLEHQDAKAGYHILYDREWQTVSQSAEHTVWRLMDRGDYVAQVTITPWTRAEKGKHLSAEDFTKAMAETPGWEPEEELEAGEVPSNDSRWIYRLSAVGQLDGAKVMQNFYIVAGPNGEQVVLAFTLEPKNAKRLGTRDVSLAVNLEFAEGAKEAEKPR